MLLMLYTFIYIYNKKSLQLPHKMSEMTIICAEGLSQRLFGFADCRLYCFALLHPCTAIVSVNACSPEPIPHTEGIEKQMQLVCIYINNNCLNGSSYTQAHMYTGSEQKQLNTSAQQSS